MNERQQAYFRMLLIGWKRSIHSLPGRPCNRLPTGPNSARRTSLIVPSSETDWGHRTAHARPTNANWWPRSTRPCGRLEEGEYVIAEVSGDAYRLRRLNRPVRLPR